MTYELGQGTGPLRGVKVVEIAGIGPGPHACMLLADLGADVIRIDRPGGGMFGDGRQGRAQPRPAERRARPQAAGGRGHRPRPRRAGRRAGRGHAPRRPRAPRARAGRVPRPQPAAGLRPDDRLGPGRPVEPGRRARHELHRHRRRPPRPRPGPRPAALPGQPARRLRRRLDLPRHRHPRRAARGAHQRAGAGRRRRDRRRHRAPQRDGVDLRRARRRVGRAALGPARRRHPVVRPLRDRRRAAHERRRARAAVLGRAGRAHRRRPPRPRRPGQPRHDPRRPGPTLPGADAGRVERGLRRHGRLRRGRRTPRRGAAPPAPRRPRDLRRARRRHPARAGAALLPHRGHPRQPPALPGEHTREALAAWGIADVDALLAGGAATQA